MKTQRREFGDWGEKVAAWYLQRKGYRVFAKNVQCRGGEIDIVALKAGILVFVEVKTRKTDNFGGIQSITPYKQNKLRIAAQQFCRKTGVSGAMQFDALVIVGGSQSKSISIKHYRNCF